MENEISPKYQMELVSKIEKVLWETFKTSKYKNVRFYIDKWHKPYGYEENFIIHENDENIDLSKTLHGIYGELLLKIAIDLGIETPGFIPSIPTFKNDLKNNFETVFNGFEIAFKNVEESPELSISQANSVLESIIKHILSDSNIKTKYDKNKTLYKLTEDILKEFKIFPYKNSLKEISDIGSSLLKITKKIEEIRSEKTRAHGKIKDEYIVNSPLYSYFIINSVATVGMFLISFYKEKFLVYSEQKEPEDEEEIRLEDIPF